MKSATGWALLALVLGVISLVFFLPGGGRADSALITVIEIRGQAQYKPGGAGSWQPLKVGTVVHEKDAIKTGPKSRVSLQLPRHQQNIVYVFSDAEIVVLELIGGTSGPQTNLNVKLLRGGAWTKLARSGNKDMKVTITTPNAVAAISGTKLASAIWGPDETYFCSCDGRIEVSSQGGAVTLYNGKGTRIKGRDKPTFPKPGSVDLEFVYARPNDPRLGFCTECHEYGSRAGSGGY